MEQIFRVDRSKWRTASHGKGETKLLNGLGYKCCLGFACEQLLGMKEVDIKGYRAPLGLYQLGESLFTHKLNDQLFHTQLACDAMIINDHTGLTNEQRELRLREMFEKHDIELEFYGEYETPST